MSEDGVLAEYLLVDCLVHIHWPTLEPTPHCVYKNGVKPLSLQGRGCKPYRGLVLRSAIIDSASECWI